jgi:hypothetical protein
MAFEDAPIVIYRNNSQNKLSETGADQIKKSKAEAEFYNSFVHHLKSGIPTQFKQYEKMLSYKAAQIFYILKDYPEVFESMDHLKSLKSQFPAEWRINAGQKLSQWKGGVKQRIYGWRYNKFFFPEHLNEHHKKLIRDLGYTEISSN